MTWRMTLAVILNLAVAATVRGPGQSDRRHPGPVVDPDGLPLPGVTVTATSPALQGARTVGHVGNGDFIIPFLPPGEYTVVFELRGFAPLTQTIGVAMAETQPLDVKLAIAAVTETRHRDRRRRRPRSSRPARIAQTYTATKIETLPVGRTLESAVLLAPGVSGNGPSGNIVIAGALSYEGLYLINGVNVNENLRGQPRTLYVEDAIQETKVSTGNISAEYGRFNGGVVNMITKSGGNRFSGSFRDSLTNDSWRALRPLGDRRPTRSSPPTRARSAAPS